MKKVRAPAVLDLARGDLEPNRISAGAARGERRPLVGGEADEAADLGRDLDVARDEAIQRFRVALREEHREPRDNGSDERDDPVEVEPDDPGDGDDQPEEGRHSVALDVVAHVELDWVHGFLPIRALDRRQPIQPRRTEDEPRHRVTCRPPDLGSASRDDQRLHQAVPDDGRADAAAARGAQVMAEPILYHRAPAFVEIYERVLKRLPEVFQTGNDVLCFASTGSGALESAVSNLVRPGGPALVASCGKFGERWAELCEAFGADLTHVAFEWGEKVDPDRVDAALAEMDPKPRVVFTTQSETSTGVLNDIEALAEVGALARRDRSASTPSRAWRRGPAAGRVGRRRRRLGFAEVADVPARAGFRLGLAARPGSRRGAARWPLLLRLGEDGRRASASRRPIRPSPPR